MSGQASATNKGQPVDRRRTAAKVGWRRGSDAADRTQFFTAVHKIKTLCLEKPSAL